METRANYIAIGIFTILGFIGLLGFLAWFANTEFDRQFDYYEVRFVNVSGLDQASTVRFAGLVVGQVVDLRLSDNGEGTVTVRLEVAANTPIRTDSVASIESQGVTGVSYISITAGSPDQPLLADVSDAEAPEITAGQSLFQSLTEGVPELLDETLVLIQDVQTLFGPENRARFENIMINLSDSSANLNRTLDQFSTVADTVGTSISDIASFTEGLSGISTSVESTLAVADDALAAIRNLSERADVTLDASTAALDSATRTFDSAQVFIDGELTAALADITETSSSLRAESQALAAQAGTLLGTWNDTGAAATARLAQTEALIDNADRLVAQLETTLATIDTTAASITSFVEIDARTLVAQTTQVVDTLDSAIRDDLPSILADVRSATATANATFATLSEDVTSASGRLDSVLQGAETTLATVADTFARANITLGAIEQALANSEATLDAAEGAFLSADQLINDDLIGISDELRTAVETFNRTLDAVADDIPAATADLRATTEVARTAFTDLSRIVANGEAPINVFLSQGLPQFSRLAIEGQRLLATLDQLTRRIERDPARFLLGREAPEFRR